MLTVPKYLTDHNLALRDHLSIPTLCTVENEDCNFLFPLSFLKTHKLNLLFFIFTEVADTTYALKQDHLPIVDYWLALLNQQGLAPRDVIPALQNLYEEAMLHSLQGFPVPEDIETVYANGYMRFEGSAAAAAYAVVQKVEAQPDLFTIANQPLWQALKTVATTMEFTSATVSTPTTSLFPQRQEKPADDNGAVSIDCSNFDTNIAL
ncbi:MAG: hypothetical protein A3J38_06340 [Gammaproteobacteria bacterium RIFCSPHIGHO2_12_FULL_45_9]|nr:MAG: hypothetical protein A3J38_06340 [Gammaproteobacteria bacterium RIFCSPHIGHO2_12_FULL_45_9]